MLQCSLMNSLCAYSAVLVSRVSGKYFLGVYEPLGSEPPNHLLMPVLA